MTEPIDPRIREYLETFSETCAENCKAQFEAFLCEQIQSFLEQGLKWEVIQDLVTLCYASYRRGIQDGTKACMEVWKLCGKIIDETEEVGGGS